MDESTTRGASTSAQRCLQRVDLSCTGSTSEPLAADQRNRLASDDRRAAAFGQIRTFICPVNKSDMAAATPSAASRRVVAEALRVRSLALVVGHRPSIRRKRRKRVEIGERPNDPVLQIV